jgi:hypothetical protein
LKRVFQKTRGAMTSSTSVPASITPRLTTSLPLGRMGF